METNCSTDRDPVSPGEVPVIILAGGKSRRMGRDKLALVIGGGTQTILESVVSRFEEEFDNVYISVADEAKYPEIKARRIVDIQPGAGPISGLHATLTELPDDGVFLAAADLPFACPRVAKRIIELSDGFDACIIKLPDGKIEPLFGFYRRSVLPLCADAINSGNNKMAGIIYNVNTRFITPADLGQLWNGKLIMNINYPDDYERING